MKHLIKLLAICIVSLGSLRLLADGREEKWILFINEVAKCRNDDTNRVYYAGDSNRVSFLYHESAKGIREWQISNVNLSDAVRRPFSRDKKFWVRIKGDNDEKLSNWDSGTEAHDFIARLPIESALVKAADEFFTPAGDRHYKDGTPMLACRREYKIVATTSSMLETNGIVSLGWSVEGYDQVTNILANSNEYQRHSIADGRILYVTWDAEMFSQGETNGYYYISDAFAVPMELVWDSDVKHEALIPFDEKIVIEAYVEKAEDRIGNIRKKDYTISDFWSSVITEPCGQTNAVYYAGTTNGNTILFHETSAGIRKWNLKNANIEKSIIMPYTEDRNKWIVLKDSGEDRFRHWDWHKEIEGFIQRQSKNSALVKPLSTFYKIEGDLSADYGWTTLVEVYSVEATLCDTLKKGDKICTTQLYDGSKDDRRRIRLLGRSCGQRIVGRKKLQGSMCFAYWDKGKFIKPEELPSESFFIIGNEIVAPFEFMWNNTYDGLLEFDEKFAQDAYIKRTQQKQ